jgi:hypothetical protein
MIRKERTGKGAPSRRDVPKPQPLAAVIHYYRKGHKGHKTRERKNNFPVILK